MTTANMDVVSEDKGLWVWDVEGQQLSSLLEEHTLVRKIIGIDPAQVTALVAALRHRVSSNNPDDGNQYYSVKNPMVCGVVQPGLWRLVNIKSRDSAHNPGRVETGSTIIQTLAYGWAQKINWDEARLVENPNFQPYGADTYKFLTVVWPNLAIDKLVDMAASLMSLSWTDPVIYGIKFSGVWWNSGVTPSLARDGSGIITLNLSIQYRDTGFYPTAISSDAVVETRQQLGLTAETPESPMPATGEVRSQSIELAKDSSKNIRTNAETGVAQENTTTIVSAAGTKTISEKSYQASPLTATGAVQGYIKRFVNRVSKYLGMYDTVLEVEQPADQVGQSAAQDTFADSGKLSHSELGLSSDPATAATQIQNLITGVRAIIAAIPSYIGLNKGEAGSVEITPTPAGNVRAIVNLDNSNDSTLTIAGKNPASAEVDAFSKRTIEEETATDTPLDVPTFGAGIIQSVVNELTRFKNIFRTRKVREEAIAQTISRLVIDREDGSITEIIKYHNAPAMQTIAANDADVAAGKTVRYEGISLNRFLLYDYTKIIKTDNAPTSAGANGYSWVVLPDETYWLPAVYNSDGSLYKAVEYQYVYTHTVKYFTTAAAAAAYVNNGAHGSNVEPVGAYLWMARRIDQSEAATGNQQVFGQPY